MEKIAFDLYDCQSKFLDNPDKLYKICEQIAENLKVDLIYKPTIVPYFYGKDRLDDGVSCLNMFRSGDTIGFFTLHTFSKRMSAYFDVVSNSKFSKKKLQDYLVETLNVGEVESPAKFTKTRAFGLELKVDATAKSSFNLDKLYDLQNEIIKEIDITQIHHTIVEKNQNVVCLLSLIAESHVGVFYNKKEKTFFIDIFSCKYFDKDIILDFLEKKNIQIETSDIKTRGKKHYDILK